MNHFFSQRFIQLERLFWRSSPGETMAFLFLVYFFRNLSVWTVNDFGSCFSLAEKQLLRAIYIARIVLVNKTPALRRLAPQELVIFLLFVPPGEKSF